MMDDFFAFVGCLVVIILVMVITAVGVVGTLGPRFCLSKAEAMGVEARWGYKTNCIIEVDGQWIPVDQYIIIKEAE